jgi:hypothetical protein
VEKSSALSVTSAIFLVTVNIYFGEILRTCVLYSFHNGYGIEFCVTSKNVVFLDIKPHFVPHRRHITSLLQISAGYCYVSFEIFSVASIKNDVSWYVRPCGSCANQRFGGTIASVIRVTRIGELGITLAVTSNRSKLSHSVRSQKTAIFVVTAVKTSNLT